MQRLTCQWLRVHCRRQPFTRQPLLRPTQEDPRVTPHRNHPKPPGRLARLADFAFRRRRLVVVAWIVALVVAFGAASQLAGDYGRLLDAGIGVQGGRRAARRPLPAADAVTVDVVWQAQDARRPR